MDSSFLWNIGQNVQTSPKTKQVHIHLPDRCDLVCLACFVIRKLLIEFVWLHASARKNTTQNVSRHGLAMEIFGTTPRGWNSRNGTLRPVPSNAWVSAARQLDGVAREDLNADRAVAVHEMSFVKYSPRKTLGKSMFAWCTFPPRNIEAHSSSASYSRCKASGFRWL